MTGTDAGALTGTSASITTTTGTATKYLVTSSNYSPVAGTDVTITAQLADVNGNPVATSGKVVTWTKSDSHGSFATATSTTNTSGTATVVFTTYTVAGTVTTVTGTDAGALTGTSASITTVVGLADATASTLTPTSASITADGTSAQVLTVTAKDLNGNRLSTGGATVTIIQMLGSGSIGPVTDNSDGTYTATVTSSTLVGGGGLFVATLGGAPVKSGTVSQTQSTITYTALEVGDAYGGGKVAYILLPGNPGYDADVQHGLIAAAADVNSGTWVVWSNITNTLIGATAEGTAIGTGQANTTAIVGQSGCTGGAAFVCDNLVQGGHSDWYLPSKDELNELYINRVALGGFVGSSDYCSSSEFDASQAWIQNFGSGTQFSAGSKSLGRPARPVRSF